MDTDILKTLESIEKLLKSSSALAGEKKLPTSVARAQQTSSQRAGKDANRAFRATSANLKDTNDAVTGLNKSLVSLNTEVDKTSTGFGSLNSQMSKFMASLTPVQAPESAGPAAAEGGMAGFMNQLIAETIKSRTNSVENTTSVLQFLRNTNDTLRGIHRALDSMVGQPNPTNDPNSIGHAIAAAMSPMMGAGGTMPNVNQQAAAMVGQLGQGLQQGIRPTAKTIQQLQIPFSTTLQRMIQQIGNTSSVLGGLSIVGSNLYEVVKKLTGDFFMLSRIGMGSTGNLLELSKNALLSGMSLKEYTEVINRNISVAARAGTLDNFNKIISAADGQLATMGIFGQEAKQLQASLAQSSTMMGVSQGKLTGAISAQVAVFDQLRKSTNMTAEEFAGLMDGLSKNEQVQKELVGLAPQQRMARQQEMLQLATTGQRLGLAADASKELAEALIKQRGETVKGRFEQAGRIRQLGQLTGMGGEGERAAQIVMKGRAATANELEELRGIAGRLDSASQNAYENGSLGVQSAMDYFQETLGNTSFGGIMKANRPAELAQDSGKVNQEAFGKHVGEFGKFTGELLKYIRGFNESIGPAVVGAVGGGLALLFRGPLIRLLQGALGRFAPGMAAGVAGAVSTGASAAPGALSSVGNAVSKLMTPLSSFKNTLTSMVPSATAAGKATGQAVQWVKNVPTMLRQAYNAVTLTNAISGPANTVKFMFQELGSKVASASRTAGSSIMQGTKTVVTSMSGVGGTLLNTLRSVAGRFAPAAMLIDGVMEAFTGQLAGALDPSNGILSRVGSVFVAAVAAVPQMIIDSLSWIFGDSFMKPIQSVFDVIKTGVVGAINGLGLALMSGVSWLTDLLPEDSGLRKMVNSAKESLAKSLDENANTINKLGGIMGGENQKTLAEISDENAKAAAAADKKSKAATATVAAAASKFNNVQYGMNLDRNAIIQDAKTILAEPQVQTPVAVKPAAVNTADDTAAKAGANPSEQAIAAMGGPDVLAALNAILAVMRENLVQEQRQAELAEQLVKGNRPMASFVSAEVLANRVLKGT